MTDELGADPARSGELEPIVPGVTAQTSASLARILDAASFGLEVVAPDGSIVYANPASASGQRGTAGPGAEQTVRSRRLQANVAGETYELSLSFDEAEQISRERDLIQRAYFDELTELPNRSLFQQSVNALAADGSTEFAVAFIDLDGFKHVNDYYGHAVGDGLLNAFARRLSATMRPSDLLARLAGDEFAMLVSPAGDADALARDLDWMAERIREPFVVDGHEIFISASIGVSVFPRNGDSCERLLSNADRAMYWGKGSTKGFVRFCDASIEHAASQRSRLEQRLRLAIRDKRVCCAFQPKVDLRTSRVAGLEVLMRWIDEDGIIQPPGDFLALAVELGLMDDLTHFILNETIASIDRINEAFGRDCSISVNIAARQAGNAEFMRSIVDALAATGFANRFMLELTEEAFLSKSEFQSRILPMVREVGARISIDDFGVGYSSLAALADITADEVKIDRSFVTDVHRRPRSQSVLKAIEALGHSLGMSIVVEGVETFEELAFLQAATRIHYGQGFYFSKPVLLEELTSVVLAQANARTPAAGRETAATRGAQLRPRAS